MTAKWGIYHKQYDWMSANSIQVVYTNDLAISRINGLGFVPTRATNLEEIINEWRM